MKYSFKKTTLFVLILAALTLLPGNGFLTHAGDQTLTITQQKINTPPDNGPDMREFLPGENLILQDPKTAGLSSSESIVLNQLKEIIRFVSQSQVPSGGEQSKINLEFEPLKAGAAELIFKSGSSSKRLNIEVLPGLNYFMLPKVDLVNAGEVETIQIGLSGTFNVVMPHPQFNLVEVSEKVSSDELSEGELKLLKENTEKVMPFVGVNPNPQETGLFDLLFTGLDQPGTVKFLFEVIPACRWEPKPCAQSSTTKTLNVESVSGIEPSGVQRVDLRNLEGKEVSLQKAAGGDLQMVIPRPEYRFVRIEQEMKGELTEDYGTQIAWDILSQEAGFSERDKSNIRIQAFEKARWLEDRCMGWDIPGESCTGKGVPKGFLLVIELYGNIYKFHGDIHRPALTRLDPSKIAALVAMKDVGTKGDGFSKIKLGKIMPRYENQVLLFDVELVAKKKQWKYTVDFKQKAVLSYSMRLSNGRVPVYDPAGNLIREDRPDGSYLELRWDPLYRTAILHDPQGNTFAYQGLNYTDSRKGILSEYTLLTTDSLAVPPRFISGRFFETVVNGVRSLHLHRHGVDILFDPKNPQVVANIIMGREDILSLLKTAEENLNLEDSKRIERIEARIQIILNKVIQQIREPEPPFPPDTISMSQIQDFQSLTAQPFKKWREGFSKVPTLSDLAVITLTDTFAQFQAGVEHFDPAKHKIRVLYLSDDLDAQGMVQEEIPFSETWKSVDLEPPNIMENKLNGFLTGLEAMTSYRMKIEILDRENEAVLSETPAINFITTHL
ncbi:MAG TPA: RHS repeat domain-containing protein, partial [bacterium]|nr:RHS repeat domain-containing protein [bacterium]